MEQFEQELVPGIYEHYKGKRYEVLGIGRHTETEAPLVVYAPLYEAEKQPKFWIRPYDMFVGDVEVRGEIKPRFKKIG